MGGHTNTKLVAVIFAVTLLWTARGKLSESPDEFPAVEPEPTEVEA